jgi:hypothetical protein
MPILLRFTSPGFTAEKYDETLKRLQQAGQEAPAGRIYHVCWGDKENLRVSDIWESREDFEKFGQTLRPILEDLGVTGDPEFIEIYNIIEGKKAAATTR